MLCKKGQQQLVCLRKVSQFHLKTLMTLFYGSSTESILKKIVVRKKKIVPFLHDLTNILSKATKVSCYKEILCLAEYYIFRPACIAHKGNIWFSLKSELV